jgi:uncharacterized membrane protein YeaQ/YmgE (transglycosylase-associated protein family)
MGIISWIVLGLIAGFVGSKIVNTQGQGFWLDIALGIVGALAGGRWSHNSLLYVSPLCFDAPRTDCPSSEILRQEAA